ncbi:MAG: hypothetical protein GY851_29925 [bacterium]|nr:hypothetical protein [bacterium]
MRKVALLALVVIGAATLGGLTASAQTPASADAPEGVRSLVRDLERYVGRELTKDKRAATVDINWLLPQACPPFYLRDEEGRIIDPTVDPEVSTPVSIYQTCMKCKETHDPNKVLGGYHFQMGFDELYDHTRTGEPISLDKSPGFYGKWQCLYQRELAPKQFSDPDDIDMTAFEWVTSCAVCHPGGGPGVFDRGGRRYDQVQSEEPLISTYQYDGDYWEAKWHKSGVLEVDCLICHMKGYEYSQRAQQIKKENFRWAATEAAGFGNVEGAVKDGDRPSVKYNTNLFRADGKVHLEIQRPDDTSCMFCHTMSGVQKRGTAWHTQYLQDVHTDIGIGCTDCHVGDIRHNFAKGNSSNQTVRDDLDNSMLSCKECHYETHDYGAPDYDHPGIPPIHFERMECTSCHISRRPFAMARVVDSLTGKVIELSNASSLEPFENAKFGALWGIVDFREDTYLRPFTADQIAAAASITIAGDSPLREAFLNEDGACRLPDGAFEVASVMDDGATVALADSRDKRALMLLALEQVVKPAEGEEVACLFRGAAYRILKGKMLSIDTSLQPRRVGQIEDYPVTHMMRTVDGKDVIESAGYQMGVYWAFEQNGEIRPLFPRDMQAAWDWLEERRQPPAKGEDGDVTYVLYRYPASPAGVAEVVPHGDPATAVDKDSTMGYLRALAGRMAQYRKDDIQPVTVWDDNNDVWPEVNTEEEMGTIAWAISQTMGRLDKGEEGRGPVTLYYVKGLQAYKVTLNNPEDLYGIPRTELPKLDDTKPYFGMNKLGWRNKKWATMDVRTTQLNFAVETFDVDSQPQLAALVQYLPWSMSHGVEPSGFALGANGCTDCHSMDSDFFFAKVMTDPFDEEGKASGVANYELLGYDIDSLRAAAWREQWLKPYSLWIVLLVLAAIAIHFAIFGNKSGSEEYVADTLRFSFIERMGHLVLMTSVTYLAVTGFCYLLGINDPLGACSRTIHALVGYVAAAGVVIAFVRWAAEMLPQKGDLTWLMHMGGYLGGKGHWPAHKFNAGQKILFWKVVGIMGVLIATGIIMGLNRGERFPMQGLVYFLHDAAALIMILLLLGHFYLGVVVNPHSVRSLFGGIVSAKWAKEHHPNWKGAKR